MTTYHITPEQFTEILRELPEKFTDAAVRGLRSAARRLEGFAVEEITNAEPYPAVATGELAGSVETTDVEDGAIVKVTAPHAPFIEEGTRPHFPPLQPLIDWVKIKGFAGTSGNRDARGRFIKKSERRSEADIDAAARRIAGAIAAKIARDGIAPRHFFAKAVRRVQPEIPVEIAREMNRISG